MFHRFQNGNNLCPPGGIFGKVWRNIGKGATSISLIEARAAAQHPIIMHRKACTANDPPSSV